LQHEAVGFVCIEERKIKDLKETAALTSDDDDCAESDSSTQKNEQPGERVPLIDNWEEGGIRIVSMTLATGENRRPRPELCIARKNAAGKIVMK